MDYANFNSGHQKDPNRLPSFPQSQQGPVVRVNWREATNFCHWLTVKERGAGLLQLSQRYRLPKVEEWRQALVAANPGAAGAGQKRLYLWGSVWPPPSGVGNLAGQERTKTPALANLPYIRGYTDPWPYATNTSAVGALNQDKSSFCDLVGNVWELCADAADKTDRIAVGGAWDTANMTDLTFNYAFPVQEKLTLENLGFRCMIVEE
jgi:formylglycine-generating enzyme required for sulfatase activity